MIEAKPYPQEQQRLAALKKTHLLDTPIEERFERITRMVCKLLDVPIALFNLIDEDRQHYKSVQGLDNYNAPLEGAFCTHAIHEKEMMLVTNASQDERFQDNPFVTGELLNIGFYAGCPVRTPDGMPIGTLCAIDTKPRDFTRDELKILCDLAAMVETELKVAAFSKAQKNVIEELDDKAREALIDPVTRLWNQDGMMRILEREWNAPENKNAPITIIMAGIDDFKNINTTFGAKASDAALKTVAKKLLEGLKGKDTVARFANEDFMVVVTNSFEGRDAISQIVEGLSKNVSVDPLTIGLTKYNVTMSFGIASAMPGDGTIDDLIKQAQQALLTAKKAKGKKIEFAA